MPLLHAAILDRRCGAMNKFAAVTLGPVREAMLGDAAPSATPAMRHLLRAMGETIDYILLDAVNMAVVPEGDRDGLVADVMAIQDWATTGGPLTPSQVAPSIVRSAIPLTVTIERSMMERSFECPTMEHCIECSIECFIERFMMEHSIEWFHWTCHRTFHDGTFRRMFHRMCHRTCHDGPFH